MIKKLILIGVFLLVFFGWKTSQKNETAYLVNAENKLSTVETFLPYNVYKTEGEFYINSSFFGEDKFGLSFWVFPEDNLNWTTLFSIGNENSFLQLSTKGNPNGDEIGLNITSKIKGVENRIFGSKDKTILVDQFNHIYIQFNKEKVSLYLNGEKLMEGKVTRDSVWSEGILSVGQSLVFNDPKFKGLISSFMVENYLKDDTDIFKDAQQYNAEICQWSAANYETQNKSLDLDFSDLSLIDACKGLSLEWMYDPSIVYDFKGEIILSSSSSPYTIQLKIEDKLNSKTLYSDFHFNELSEDQEIFNQLRIDFMSQFKPILHSNEKLTTQFKDIEIQWQSLSEGLNINDGIITKNIKGKQTFEVELSYKYKDLSKSELVQLTVLDDAYAHIMSYFYEPKGNSSGIRLAYSLDGLNWNPLFNGEEIIKTDIEDSSSWIRDPFLFRDIRGEFKIVATQGWDNNSIYYWESTDLIEFKNHKLIRSAFYEPSIALTGKRSWAPEIVYNALNEEYWILFSDIEAGRIYRLNTFDFEVFSYPEIFMDVGYPIIDATINTYNNQTLIFYKDELEGAATLHYAFADNTYLNNLEVYDYDFDFFYKQIEGPFLLQSIKDGKWYLYADRYMNESMRVFEISSKKDGSLNVIELEEAQYQMPSSGTRHGSSLTVTKDELEKLIEAYPNTND